MLVLQCFKKTNTYFKNKKFVVTKKVGQISGFSYTLPHSLLYTASYIHKKMEINMYKYIFNIFSYIPRTVLIPAQQCQ